ncbi:unnamed protein product [Mucor hiemalis]
MINAKTDTEFEKHCASYNTMVTNEAIIKEVRHKGIVVYKGLEYFDVNWLTCKEKGAFYLTRKHSHFGCTTSQRVESSHRALKLEVMSTRFTITQTFNTVDQYIKRHFNKQKTSTHEEKYKIDTLLRKNHQLGQLIGKVSAKCLMEIHKALLAIRIMKEEELKEERKVVACDCVIRKCYLLPCIHTLLPHEEEIPLCIIQQRWFLQTADHANVFDENNSILPHSTHDSLEGFINQTDNFSNVLKEIEIT